MANITKRIHNLVAGISQQPAILRRPEQLSAQLNGLSTESAGLQKRPPTRQIARLMDNTRDLYKVHFINRSDDEQYVVFAGATGLKVWDLAGTAKTVTNNAPAYLANITAPNSQLRLQTVADYTFVVNKLKTVAMSNTVGTDTMQTQGYLVNIKQGMYGRTYQIWVDHVKKAEYITPTGSSASDVNSITTDYIKDQLVAGLQSSLTGWTITAGSSWLCMVPPSGWDMSAHTIELLDGYNNASLKLIAGKTTEYSNIPASAPDGYVVKITGTNNSADDYYVKYSSSDLTWEECVKPGLKNTIDKTTMPCSLVRNSDGTFTFDYNTWKDRTAGDEDSNEVPSFVNATLNDIFFFKNRLGLLSGENVIFSDSSDFFNFWYKSAYETQDTDVIDTTVSSNRIVKLHHAVPFNTDLYLFSDEEQFVLSTDSTLTPKNCPIGASTAYLNYPDVKPVGAGDSLYFMSTRAVYASLNEYRYNAAYTDVRTVEDVSAHIPSYIPNYPYKMVCSTNENIIGILSSSDRSIMSVYKYLYLNGTRAQQSWSKWKFSGDILGAEFIGNLLYLVIARDSGIYLESMIIQYDTAEFPEEPYRVMLDRKQLITLSSDNSSYNSITGQMTVNSGMLMGDMVHDYGLVTTTGQYYEGTGTIVLPNTGDLTGYKVILGEPYEFSIEMSTFSIKQTTQGGMQEDVPVFRLMIQKVWFEYAETGYFEIVVNDTYKYKMTCGKVGKTVLGHSSLQSGSIKVPIRKPNDKAVITVQSSLPFPIALVGAGWEANYTTRHKVL